MTYRTFIAVQICAIRLYGRFLGNIHELSLQIISYLNLQLELPPSLTVEVPEREATYLEHRKNILNYLGFGKFDEATNIKLTDWLMKQAYQGYLPMELIPRAEKYLLSENIILPGSSVLERLVIHACSESHIQLFQSIYERLSPELRQSMDSLLTAPEGEQRSYFHKLKEYPPSAKISSLQDYLKRYQTLSETGIENFEARMIDSKFMDYLFRLARTYHAKDLKRFNDNKRYSLMICFLLETRRILLDHLMKMHDQYIMDMCRKCKNKYEKKHREFRKRYKKAVDTILIMSPLFVDLPDDKPFYKKDLWQKEDEEKFKESIKDLYIFKKLEERGYGDLLLNRYPSLRKYFADFIQLPFAAEQGSNALLQSIDIIRDLDSGKLKKLPHDVPENFVPNELQKALRDQDDEIKRNAWEMALALAIKDKLRSGDLYLPQSKQYVSFWNLVLNEPSWEKTKEAAFAELQQPKQQEIELVLTNKFNETVDLAKKSFKNDDFATIQNGKLKLKRVDKIVPPTSVIGLQKTIDSSMPTIRIEKLLIEVDQLTGFTRHFVPISEHHSRPSNFYKTLIAALISQATNLGVVSMSGSVQGVSVDMLRHVLNFYIREDTIKAASAEIVNQHHQLPLSSVHGKGTISSSDAQRFKIRADSLLASYYPRYYGYYEKAIGIYTHVSDQYAVYSTKIISCSPREALYVLDGLLENNTILKIREHTTDTHGYTEIVFALCYLLGYYFMPRIRDLKDQQLYRVDRNVDYGVFTPLLNKTADLEIIEEQWEAMIRVALSLKQRTAPAHVIVQRLTNSFPSDRLSKAFTNLGRIIKTEYILRYITDPALRGTVQLQLNKGEYRHKLPRRVFFADQGEFTVGDYEEIMNKASCLSLVSNAVLYWNTIKISDIVQNLRDRGEKIDEETLSHISLLPFKHVLPNGTYFIDDL
jgi:TnpA family transposase